MITTNFPRWARVFFVALLSVAVFFVVFRLGSRDSAGVTLSDPVVWVEDGARGRILQVNGSTREITASVDVTDSRVDELVVLPNGRDAVFLNRTSGEYGEIGAVDLEPANQVDTGATNLEDAVFLEASDPETGQHNSYVITPDEVLIYAGDSTEAVNIPTSSGLGDVITAATGQLVAVTADQTQLLVSDPTGLVSLAELSEPASVDAPIELVRAGDSLYAIDPSRRNVREVDVSSGSFGSAESVCGPLDGSAFGGNVLTESNGDHVVLAHDARGGTLSVTDPQSGECFEIALGESGDNFGAPVAVDDVAYLPNYETGQVVVVDLAEQQVTRVHAFTPVRGRAFELEVFDGAVWANEPQGPRVAVLNPGVLTPISKQQTVLVVGVGDEPGDEAIGGAAGDNADGQRVFGEGGDLFEGFTQDQSVPLADESVVPITGNGPQLTDEAGDEVVDGELLTGEVAELVDAPELVEPVEVAPTVQTLLANFSFSTDVLLVGEEVRLTDDSAGDPTQWNGD